MSKQKRKRKFQVSLRFFFILTVVVALILVMPVQRSLIQKRGRVWVDSQNGHVTFAHKYDAVAEQYNHDLELPAPGWLVGILGIDIFDSVDAVVLDNKVVVDLSPLTDLRKLRSLGIMIEIDEQLDFSPLAELKNLECLHLAYTGISAERLIELQELLPWVKVTADIDPVR